MKKDLTTLAMMGLLAGANLSASEIPTGKEVAMSRCTREMAPKNPPKPQTNTDSEVDDTDGDYSSCNAQTGCDGNTGCSECEGNDSEEASASAVMKAKRLSVSEKL